MRPATPEVSAPWSRVIVVDGDAPGADWRCLVAPGATVIAADGGLRHARRAGVAVTDLVGDFDSLDDAEVDTAADCGVRVHRHPRDKDFTDFALAARLAHAAARAVPAPADRLLVVGGAGGRIDHELGNFAVLAGAELAPFATTALMGDAVVHVVRGDRPVRLGRAVGTTVSIVPFGGTATGITTTGLEFALDAEDLGPGTSRGISNRVAAPTATVAVSGGVVFVIEPDGARPLVASLTGEET